MHRYFKIIGICLFLIFTLSSWLFSEESFTITTYYPSPYGVYKNLRIYPNDDYASGDACSNAGEMSYDASANQMLVCDGSTNQWKNLGGNVGESVMYLRTTVAPSANCPSEWTQADYQLEIAAKDAAGNFYLNYVRTCYRTNRACQVTYLRSYGTIIGGMPAPVPPANCPSEWTQADYTSEYTAGGSANYVRTCYRCN